MLRGGHMIFVFILPSSRDLFRILCFKQRFSLCDVRAFILKEFSER